MIKARTFDITAMLEDKIVPLEAARMMQKAAAGEGEGGMAMAGTGGSPSAGVPIPEWAGEKGLLISKIVGNFSLTVRYRKSKLFRRYAGKVREAIEFIARSYIPPVPGVAGCGDLCEHVGMSLAFIAVRRAAENALGEDGEPEAQEDRGGAVGGFMETFGGMQFYESLISSVAALYGNGGVTAILSAVYENGGTLLRELSDVAAEEAAAQFLFERAFCDSGLTETTACRLAVPETLSEKMECFLLYMRSLIGGLVGEASRTDISQHIADSLNEAAEKAKQAEGAEGRVREAQAARKKAEGEAARLKYCLAEAEKKARAARAEAEEKLRGELTEKSQEIRRLKRRIAALEGKRGEGASPEPEMPPEEPIADEAGQDLAPVADMSRILFVVGIEGEARSRIEAAFPGSRVERPEKASDELVRGSSLVVYNTGFAKHGQYWRVRGVAAAAGVPFLHTTAHNVEKLEELVRGHVAENIWDEYVLRREENI